MAYDISDILSTLLASQQQNQNSQIDTAALNELQDAAAGMLKEGSSQNSPQATQQTQQAPAGNAYSSTNTGQYTYDQLMDKAAGQIGNIAQATTNSLNAQLDAARREKSIGLGLADTYQKGTAEIADASDNIKEIDRYTNGPLGGLGSTVVGLLGMFDDDYNQKYQEQRIATARNKMTTAGQQAQILTANENNTAKIAELQQKLARVDYDTIMTTAGVQDDELEHSTKELRYMSGLTEEQQQAARVKVDNASDALVAKNANIKSPDQGLWQVENRRREQTKLALQRLGMDNSLTNQKALFSKMSSWHLEQALASQQGDVIGLTNGNKVIPVPRAVAQSALISARAREDQSKKIILADQIQANNLPKRLGDSAALVQSLSPYNSRIATIGQALTDSAKDGVNFQSIGKISNVMDMLNTEAQKTATNLKAGLPTKASQGAVDQYIQDGGHFTATTSRDFLSGALAGDTVSSQSVLAPVMAQIKKDSAQQGPTSGGNDRSQDQALAGLFQPKPKQIAQNISKTLQDPQKLKQYQGMATNLVGGSELDYAVQDLAAQPNARPVWTYLAKRENQHLWHNNAGQADNSMLASFLAKQEIRDTAANGDTGKDMRGVYNDTVRQALDNIKQNPDNTLGRYKHFTMHDQAAFAQLYGSGDPLGAIAKSQYNAYVKTVQETDQRMQQLANTDMTGRTAKTNRLFSALANGVSTDPGSGTLTPYTLNKNLQKAGAAPVTEDNTQSAQGTGLPVSTTRRIYSVR